MQTMITFDDLKTVTPRVLDRLKTLSKLPAHGIVAGQAVASLVYEELGLNIKGPINDIDIFVSKNLPADEREVVYSPSYSGKFQRRTFQYHQWQKTISERKHVSIRNDDENAYKHINIIGQRGLVSILRTYRRDIRNYTLIDGQGVGPSGYVSEATAQGLVNGFDLNCVAVGIDLYSQKMVCSDQFLEFLNTPVLKPQSYHNPSYTLIRLTKKLFVDKMEGVTCDFEQEKQILCDANDVLQSTLSKNGEGSFLYTFGPKYHTMIQPLLNHLPETMVVEVGKQQDYPLWTFVNSKPDAVMIENLSELFLRQGFEKNIVFAKHFRTLWNLSDAHKNTLFETFKIRETDHFDLLKQITPLQEPLVVFENHTSDETALKLLNCSLSEQDKVASGNLYNSFSKDKHHLFEALDGSVSDIALFHSNPQRFYTNKFLEFGPKIFQYLSASTEEDILEIQKLFFEWARTEEGRKMVRQSVPKHKYHLNYFPPPINKTAFINELVAIALEYHPIEQHETLAMTDQIFYWAVEWDTNIPPTVPSSHAKHVLTSLHYLDEMRTDVYTPHKKNILETLLTALPNEDLEETSLFFFLTSGGMDIVKQRLLTVTDETLKKIKQYNEEQIQEIYRKPPKLLTEFVDAMEHIALTRAIQPHLCNTEHRTKTGRKM